MSSLCIGSISWCCFVVPLFRCFSHVPLFRGIPIVPPVFRCSASFLVFCQRSGVPPVFCYSAGVPCSVVPCSSVPGFIVCLRCWVLRLVVGENSSNPTQGLQATLRSGNFFGKITKKLPVDCARDS